MKRYGFFEQCDYSGFCGRFERESSDGTYYPIYYVRTWFHGMKDQDYARRVEWCQLVLAWHGKLGLKLLWLPVSDR